MKTAILLSAGRGERLRPLTDTIPKPLCKVQGIPLIEYHLQHLSEAGFKRIIINHAHLGDQIRQALGDGNRWGLTISYSPEPPGALETGGGIYHCIQRFHINEPFMTVNADIFTDYPFAKLCLPKGSLAHLVLVPNPAEHPNGDFGLSTAGFLSEASPRFTVAGIIGYHPELFAHCKPGRYSVMPVIRSHIANNQITGTIYQGLWQDIGAIERLAQVQQTTGNW
jgi:MurNAc alpha-1-phosphate uridylyltransferase